MPDSFLTAAGVVIPMALLMLLGVGLRKTGLTDRSTMRGVDNLLFRLFMPVLLFKNIYETDISQSFTPKEALFIAAALLALFPAARPCCGPTTSSSASPWRSPSLGRETPVPWPFWARSSSP